MSKTITVQPSWNNGASNIQFTNGVTFNKKPEEETRCCMTCCGCCCDDDSGGPAGSYGYTNNFSSDSPSNFIGGDSDIYTGGYGGGDDGGGGGYDSGGGCDSGGGGCDSGGGGCDSGAGGCDSGGVD